MLSIQKKLSPPFLAILGLPATAVGFALSTQIAALSWLLSTRFGMDIHSVAVVWLAGPLAGIIGQPIVGAISDKIWFLGGRRKGFIIIGGVLGSLMFFSLPQIGIISHALGFEGVIVIATVVALMLDLSINVTFNPARSIIADLTPEGDKRTSGYTIMQLLSGISGLMAYFISIVLGNIILIYIAVGIVLIFSILPSLLIEETKNLPGEEEGLGASKTTFGDVYRLIFPLSGFLLFSVYLVFDKLILQGKLEYLQVPITVFCLVITVILGFYVIVKGWSQPSDLNEFHKITVAHSFSWLGIQSMFVMSFFFAQQVIVPGLEDGKSIANSFSNLMTMQKTVTITDLQNHTYVTTKIGSDRSSLVIQSQESFDQLVEMMDITDLKGVSLQAFVNIVESVTIRDYASVIREIRESQSHDGYSQSLQDPKDITVLFRDIQKEIELLDPESRRDWEHFDSPEAVTKHLVSNAISSRTSGSILSLSFLLFNAVAAFLPILILEPLCKKLGRLRVYTASILTMALAYLFIWKFGFSELKFYIGLCVAGIGWSAVISIVFAIMTERVDRTRMGLSMGLFNYSVVLPQMMTVGVAAFVRDSGNTQFLYLVCGVSLFVSFLFWCAVRESNAQES